MNKLFFMFTVLMFATAAKAEVFQGQIEDAVGSAHHLNGAACTLKVLSKEGETVYAILEVSASKTLKIPAVVTKSDRYILEKAQGYDYASHKTTEEKFIQTDISNLLKMDQAQATLTQQYNRKDSSALFADSDYYKFTCKAFR